MILGIDASTYLEEIEHGAKYFDGECEIDPLDAFVANGVNWMRIRIWNNPRSEDGAPYLAGTCDLDHYVRLAKLAKSKGFSILMDLHYSDFWADPGKQFIPKAWQGMNIEQLEKAVYDFTELCLNTAEKNSVTPDMIQIGNEITNGILWPFGKIYNDETGKREYGNFLRLIGAGVRAARLISPETKIVLHLERSNDKEVYQEFFSEVENAGIEYDILGASYYPYWHGTPDEVFANLNNCKCFGKDIMIVELGYGFTDQGYFLNGEQIRLVVDPERAYIEGISDKYPLTPEGQAAYIRHILESARKNGIAGIFYWEPLWLPGEGICWASEAGQKYIHEEGKSTSNEWANQCLFDYHGQKLPAFDEFKK